MKWNFWKKTTDQGGASGVITPKLAKPKDLPEAVGRKMVVGMKMDPDVVWSLKYVSQPVQGSKHAFEFRLFNPDAARLSGVVIKNWSSLDDHPDLVLHSGYYDKHAGRIDIHSHT
jgi:hypothetical protein